VEIILVPILCHAQHNGQLNFLIIAQCQEQHVKFCTLNAVY